MGQVISYEDYERRLARFLEACGPNPARSFFASIYWHAKWTDAFHEWLDRQGIEVAEQPKWVPNWPGRLPAMSCVRRRRWTLA
jgi:hypothetical protein